MSAEALKELRKLWGKLVFADVERVIAREPEDVLMIRVPRVIITKDGSFMSGQTDYTIESRRTMDIPEVDRWRAQVSWRHYYGFAEGGIYFQSDDLLRIDWDIDLTLDFGKYGNHRGGKYDKPKIGSLICGEIQETAEGKRFKRWFHCSLAFLYLYQMIMDDRAEDENQIASMLLYGGYPDQFWAIARLVLFDNVQAFVDNISGKRPRHPCRWWDYTCESNDVMGPKRRQVDWTGMYLSKRADQFVHELSFSLGEPSWWEEFQRLAKEQGIAYTHFGSNNWCAACAAERRRARQVAES